MGKFQDLRGQKFGRLHVTGLDGKRTYGGRERYFWSCVCSCGKTVSVCSEHLTRGAVRSCGCLQQENSVVQGKNRGTHHLGDSKIYTVWQGMKDRCYNPNNKRYKHYGGRGISVYPAWIDDFQAFYNYVSQLEHFGEDGYTLDRIDTNGNYEPGNLRWATKSEQARNKRNNVWVEYNSERMTLAEAAERSGVPYYILQNRRRVGDTGERLFRPIGSK